MNEKVEGVINALSSLIFAAKLAEEGESTYPTAAGPDAMDAKVKHHRRRAITLRALREQFEDEMARQEESPF